MGTRPRRWWEYFWAHLGERRLTRREWKTLEGLVREEATRRFKNRAPTTLQMLLAACDVREAHPSIDSLVARVRGQSAGLVAEAPTLSTAPEPRNKGATRGV